MYSDDGPPSTSKARVEAFGEAIWAVYDLRRIWKSMGPRVETLRKPPEPGRNDPCWCGSGKKFKVPRRLRRLGFRTPSPGCVLHPLAW